LRNRIGAIAEEDGLLGERWGGEQKSHEKQESFSRGKGGYLRP